MMVRAREIEPLARMCAHPTRVLVPCAAPSSICLSLFSFLLSSFFVLCSLFIFRFTAQMTDYNELLRVWATGFYQVN